MEQGKGVRSSGKEKSIEAYHMLNKFLCGFIDHVSTHAIYQYLRGGGGEKNNKSNALIPMLPKPFPTQKISVTSFEAARLESSLKEKRERRKNNHPRPVIPLHLWPYLPFSNQPCQASACMCPKT
jgi:hypothetical protein